MNRIAVRKEELRAPIRRTPRQSSLLRRLLDILELCFLEVFPKQMGPERLYFVYRVSM